MRWAATLLLLVLPVTSAGPEAIQPGDLATTGSSSCTLGFVFDGTGKLAGNVYASTAAHCVAFVGQGVDTPGHPGFAKVAYLGDSATGETNGIPGKQSDVALLLVKPALAAKVKGTVLGHPGLPQGHTTAAATSAGDVVALSGWGLGWGATAQTREDRVGILLHDEPALYRMEAPVTFGDSGGPVLHPGGRALGFVNHLTYGCCAAGGTGVYYEGVTVERALAEFAQHGFPVQLRNG